MKLLPNYLEYFVSPVTGSLSHPGQLPSLTHNKIWVGNEANEPIESGDYVKNIEASVSSGNIAIFADSSGKIIEDSGTSIPDLAALVAEAKGYAEDAAKSAAEAAASATLAAGFKSAAETAASAASTSAAEALASAVLATTAADSAAIWANDASNSAETANERKIQAEAAAAAAAASASSAASSATSATASAASALDSKLTCEEIVSQLYSSGITLVGDVSGSAFINYPIATTLNLTLDQILAPTNNVNLNSKKIINLANGTAANDAVNYSQLTTSVFGAVSQMIYVSNNAGSDVTGNGCITAPFATISHALVSISPSSSNPFCISLESGNYSESSLTLRPNISILGNGSRVTVSSNITLGLEFTFSESYNFIKDIRFAIGSNSFLFDLSTKGDFLTVFVMDKIECVLANDFTITASSNLDESLSPTLFIMRNCFWDTAGTQTATTRSLTATNCHVRVENSYLDTMSVENSSSSVNGDDIFCKIDGCKIPTSLTLKESGTHSLITEISAMTEMPATWTIDGANSIVKMYSAFDVSPTLVNSATFNPTSLFKNIKATATTASTSTTTGALISSGGLGVAGNGWFGGDITASGAITAGGILKTTNGTASTSITTGALISGGGLGVAGKAYIGGALNIIDTTAATSTTTGSGIFGGGLGVAGKGWFGGALNVTDTTASSSTTTGSGIFGGGVGVGGKGYFGGAISTSDTTASTSTTTGSLIAAGGLGVAGKGYFGGALNVTDTTASSSTTTGSGIFGGGLGVAGAAFFGGAIKTNDTTASSSTSTGSLIAAGGLGVAKKGFFGEQLSAPSIIFTSTTGVVGTTTNDSAAAGSVGEYVSASATSVSFTTGVVKNFTSMSLTAGDWDVSASMQFTASGTMTVIAGSISTTTAAHNSSSAGFTQMNLSGWVSGGLQAVPIGTVRISIASTTTVYLTGQSNFTSGTVSGNGYIAARRVR